MVIGLGPPKCFVEVVVGGDGKILDAIAASQFPSFLVGVLFLDGRCHEHLLTNTLLSDQCSTNLRKHQENSEVSWGR